MAWGCTYRAFERRLGRVVALKQIRTDTHTDPSALEAQFDREARLTARLQHPSIVAIYEAGKLGDAPFYAMRLIDGVPLDKEIARRKTLADRLALVPHVLTCAHAIAYAHEQRVVHRDVKPANVVVGKFGEAIVIDWGVACDLDEPAARSGSSVGTPAYMPPEQSKGEAADPSFDIYALGATLYHVLAGQAPYMDLPRITSSSKITPLGQLTPGVPRDLLAIVDKAIARSRDDRYASAKDLADDLVALPRGPARRRLRVHARRAARALAEAPPRVGDDRGARGGRHRGRVDAVDPAHRRRARGRAGARRRARARPRARPARHRSDRVARVARAVPGRRPRSRRGRADRRGGVEPGRRAPRAVGQRARGARRRGVAGRPPDRVGGPGRLRVDVGRHDRSRAARSAAATRRCSASRTRPTAR